jgi:hypothetical protein
MRQLGFSNVTDGRQLGVAEVTDGHWHCGSTAMAWHLLGGGTTTL